MMMMMMMMADSRAEASHMWIVEIRELAMGCCCCCFLDSVMIQMVDTT
jgi:hypothetical protein